MSSHHAAGAGIAAVSLAAVLALVRDHVTADACCPHCGKRPSGPADPLELLTAAIAAQPLNRENRSRTSGRTKAGRRKWPTEEATYDLSHPYYHPAGCTVAADAQISKGHYLKIHNEYHRW